MAPLPPNSGGDCKPGTRLIVNLPLDTDIKENQAATKAPIRAGYQIVTTNTRVNHSSRGLSVL